MKTTLAQAFQARSEVRGVPVINTLLQRGVDERAFLHAQHRCGMSVLPLRKIIDAGSQIFQNHALADFEQSLRSRVCAQERPTTMKSSRPRSALFLNPTAKYHADRCEPLVEAVARGEVRLAALIHRGYPGQPLPRKMLPEIATVGFWDATGTQSWGLDWHRNEGIELTYLARGKAEFLVDKERYVLESGHLTVMRPWQKHRVGDPNIGACELYWLILDVGVRRPDQSWNWPNWLVLSPGDLRRLTTLLRHNEQPVWRANEEIRQCFEKIGTLVETTAPASVQTRLQLSINELFLALLELLQKKNVVLDASLASARRTVEMFLAHLPDHLDHSWNLAEMAEQCGLGRTRFAEYCRQIVNMPPTDYLIHCRVESAKKLLKASPTQSITDIALDCGFQTSQYFATVFRQRTSQSPRDFRNQPQRPEATPWKMKRANSP